MKPIPNKLRAHAEQLLTKTRREVAQMPVEDVQKLVHELQVHQIELEMQNDELRRTQLELEASRDRYADLYDFAPSAHLTLTAHGEILEANLAAGKLIGLERGRLIHQKFTRFLPPEAQDAFYLFCRQVFSADSRQSAELDLVNAQAKRLTVQAEAVRDATSPRKQGRFSFTDITGRKQAEEAVRASEERFRAIAANTPDHVIIQDLDLRYRLVINPQLGLTETDMFGKTDRDLFKKADAEFLTAIKQKVLDTGKPFHLETSLPNLKGEAEFFEGDYIPKLDPTGKIDGLIGYFHNITGRKRAEERIAQLSRAKAILAGVDRAIVHIPDRQKLLDEICRVAVDEGGFKLAWIGMVSPDGSVQPVAQAGATGYLKGIRVVTHDVPEGRGPIGVAIRENRLAVIGDIDRDASMAPWRDRALKFGLHYAAAFPIRVAGKVTGSFQVYAPQADFFDENELGLLIQVSDDISFALTAMADLTARKQAEEALRRSEAQLQAIMDHSPARIFLKDRQGRYLHFNRQVAEASHLSLEKSVGRTDAELYPPNQAKAFQTDDRKVLAAGVPMNFEEVVALDDGPHTFIVTKFPLLDANGKIYAIGGIATDITDRMHMEAALRRSEHHLSNFFNQAPIGLVWLSASGTILRANQAQLDLLGYPAKDYLGHSFLEFCVEPSHGHELLERLAAKETVRNFPMTRRCQDGTIRHVLVDANSFWSDNQFQYSSIFLRDITERIKLEREILQVGEREHRRIAQDLHDGLGQLLVGTVYLASTLQKDLAAKSLPEARQLGRIMEVINEAIWQTRNLARGLHPVEPEPNGLMAALETLATRTKKMFQVRCHFTCRRPVLVQDNAVATHLFRIAQEAVTNAIKHGHPGRIEISLTETPGRINLAVKDDGTGMPARQQKKPGMGLRIMRYRAGMIGGSLAIQKEAGGGTTIVCTAHLSGEAGVKNRALKAARKKKKLKKD
jgi:PAS domain S-box-containing protein